MVTIQDAVQYVNGVACTTQKVWCKSTDVKPTEGIGNGSQLREMDTGKDYAFDAESGEWLEQPSEGGGGGGGSSTLAGLTDVDISNPTDGQTLVYDATSEKWVNGSGGSGVLILHEARITPNASNAKAIPADKMRLDKTWQEIFDAGVCFVEQILTWGDVVYKKLLPVVAIGTPDPEEGITVYNVEAYDAAAPTLYIYGVNEGGANGYPERDAD